MSALLVLLLVGLIGWDSSRRFVRRLCVIGNGGLAHTQNGLNRIATENDFRFLIAIH